MTAPEAAVAQALAEVRHRDWARLVGATARITRDAGAAEDCVQEAFLQAWRLWPDRGLPDEPAAWLRQTARNRALDRYRRGRVEADRLRRAAGSEPAASEPDDPLRDEADALGLLFACAHPALNLEAQVALTLRWGAGLETGEIARAFLVTEETMTRRLTRAKAKVRESGIPLKVPEEPWREERLASVLGVLYLLFNQGIDAGVDETDRFTLCAEALRLAEDLARRLGAPDDAEVWGLVALMRFLLGRRPARFDAEGALATLDLQDRSLWDEDLYDSGRQALVETLSRGGPGVYTLQAALSEVHSRARRWEDTAWEELVALYDRLVFLQPTAVVRLNRAVALGRSRGPEAALEELAVLAAGGELEDYAFFHAACAEFLDQAGHRGDAEGAWDRAVALAPTPADRKALQKRRGR